MNEDSYGKAEPKDKIERVIKLLPQVFEWARSVHPSRPLTSGVWDGDWSSALKLDPIQRIQLEQSDVISFHNHSWSDDFEKRVEQLERYHRPILCTEFMARPLGSTFDIVLPIAKKQRVGAIQLGTSGRKNANLLT